MRSDFDLLVVGAGPAGASCARLLAEAGWAVGVVDRSPGPRRDIVCTGIVGREGFERIDLAEDAIRAEVPTASFFSPRGVEITYAPAEPMARVVDRARFDETLLRRAERAGAALLRGLEAREVVTGPRGVAVKLRGVGVREGGVGREGRRDRPDDVVRARALVVATGYRSRLHASAGLGTAPGWVHGVHADLPFGPLDAAELYFGNGIAPGFFAWAVPFGHGVARLGVLARRGARRLFRRFLERESIASRLAPGLREGATPRDGGIDPLAGRMRSRGIVQGMVSPSFADRVVAVGEAAGQVKTTTAGGIYYGLIGAGIAAEALDEGLRRDRLDAGSLSRYERRWQAALGPEIRAGLELQAAACRMTDAQIDRLFAGVRRGLAATLREVVRFDWHRPALDLLFHSSSLGRFLSRQLLTGECA